VLGVRDRVFDYLNKHYGLYSVIDSPPLRALDRIEIFYREVILAKLARRDTVAMEMTYTFNVSAVKPQGVMLPKSDDNIFAPLVQPDKEEEEREEEEGEEEEGEEEEGEETAEPREARADDLQKFPHPTQETVEVAKGAAAVGKAVKSRKDLPYQMDGL
jgi:hypothetical protein